MGKVEYIRQLEVDNKKLIKMNEELKCTLECKNSQIKELTDCVVESCFGESHLCVTLKNTTCYQDFIGILINNGYAVEVNPINNGNHLEISILEGGERNGE